MHSLLGVSVSQSRSLKAGISGSFLIVGPRRGVGGISVDTRRLNLVLGDIKGDSSFAPPRVSDSNADKTAHSLEVCIPCEVAEKQRL